MKTWLEAYAFGTCTADTGSIGWPLPIRVFLPTLPARIRYCFLPAGISRATQGLRAATCLATPGCLAEAASQEWTLSGNQFTWLGDRCWPDPACGSELPVLTTAACRESLVSGRQIS